MEKLIRGSEPSSQEVAGARGLDVMSPGFDQSRGSKIGSGHSYSRNHGLDLSAQTLLQAPNRSKSELQLSAHHGPLPQTLLSVGGLIRGSLQKKYVFQVICRE